MNYNDEWKAYPLEGVFDEKTKLEFSRYGEVKSFNVSCPQGRLINGGLQLGYPIIRFKRYKEMDEKSSFIINNFNQEIEELRAFIKEKKKKILNKDINNKELKKNQKDLEDAKLKLSKITKSLTKARQKINKQRAIYFHILVHKAVAELFVKNDDPEKKYVIHKNFDKLDCRAENLIWATKEEVTAHSFKSPNWIKHNLELEKTGTLRRQYSKLNYNDVVFIKRKLEKGEPASRLARRFGVSDMQIYRIKSGENWGDVKLSLTDSQK